MHSLKYNINLSNACDPKFIQLDYIKELKYFNLIIYYNRWDSHINYTNYSTHKFFYVFKEAKYIFNDSYTLFYLSLVKSIFSYSI